MKIPSRHDEEVEALQARLGGMNRGDMAILGLELLEVVSRHLSKEGAQIYLQAHGADRSFLDTTQILAEMRR